MVDGIFLKNFESGVGVGIVIMGREERVVGGVFLVKNLGQCLWGLTT